MSTAMAVALVGGAFGLGGAVVTAVLGQRQARKLAQLEESQAERNTRRDYEYEALKRMYEAYEPLRFRFVDAAGSALRRISEISRGMPRTSFNSSASAPAGYHLKATVYQLLAPIALVRLMDRRLTLVDLRLSPEISVEYAIAKAIARSLSDDELVARFEPALEYTPYVAGWRELREQDPRQYRRQGLPPGRLENAVEALLRLTSDGHEELMSFATFEAEFDKLDPADVNGELAAARDLFVDFDPETRPVLWRLLVAQVLLYGCYLHVTLGGEPARAQVASLSDRMADSLRHAVRTNRRLDLYWDARDAEGIVELPDEVYERAITSAQRYYEWRVAPAVAPAATLRAARSNADPRNVSS